MMFFRIFETFSLFRTYFGEGNSAPSVTPGYELLLTSTSEQLFTSDGSALEVKL